MQVKIGSLVKFYTILLLSDGSRHGYDLMKELEEKLGKKVSASQVYPFLRILEKNRVIKVEKVGDREKKIYKITDNGKRFVNSFVGRFGNLMHIAIEPKLSQCAHCACQVYEGGHKEKIHGKLIAFCCKHCAKSFKMHH